MARFFIDRPVFAWVIAILIMMAGGISIFRLPVEQYPRIAPPVVTITAKYSGASAQTLEDTVAQVIEQKLNGIDGLLYINSTSDAAGQVSIRLTFDPDTNPDVAQMQVQNKLQLATSSLPEEVTRQGITVTKVADSFLQMYAFVSSDDSMSAADLCDFVGSTILDPLSRVDGVGEVSLFGAPYAMRIWLNPSKLLSYSLTPSDVINAVKAQNKQVSLGEVGGKPIRDGQQMNVTIKAQKQLTSVPEFERILLRVNPDGSAVRLRDVARVELGQESYTSSARYNGKPAAGVGIKLASDANALNTSNAVAAFIEDMRPYFPHGVEVVSPYDTVPFIKISIIEVVKTLLEAIVLVFAVIYLFLQNFRATIIPSLAVPVVLLGTFGVMAAFGFSINTLTMFGMVLAIGLLVDDAIVVVENVARVMEEDGLPPREATIKTMGQITGALIGVAAVLSADGLFRRHRRRHLPPVLADHRVGHDPFRRRGGGADARIVLHLSEARPHGLAAWLLRLVQPEFRPGDHGLQGGRRQDHQGRRQDDGHIFGHARVRGLDLVAYAHVVSAQRGSGHPDRGNPARPGIDGNGNPEDRGTGGAPFP